ncbi:site-specific integrase [Bifidobacterium sp. ESL0745]|uniref:tyrosine-type recombinase/integrase n=1 Tax=Bifidobacterium sp. ESL0745 TaxID=2983226 RepID=UPI0023F7B3F3|nr:site-specific integrase [Bifidobacterium sp. ESL0745]MDF7666132.1 site-specific integrase [Bifidobacterium sp. ESL0745]
MIRHSEIQQWVGSLSAGDPKQGISAKSATVVIRAYGVLKGILDMARDDQLISRNPCERIKLPHKMPKKRTYLTPSQVLTLADASGEHRTLILTLGFCGLRWGEAAALHVGDVRSDQHRLHIRLSYTKTKDFEGEQPPKTWEIRDVPVPDQVMAAIDKECKGKSAGDLVFTDKDHGDRRIDQQSRLNHGWYARALKASGVPTLTLHDLRHTAASIAVSSGANVKAVQRMLGHQKASMTLDTYADLFDSDLDEVVTRMSKEIEKAKMDSQQQNQQQISNNLSKS